MVRPTMKEATKQYTVMLPPSIVEKIDEYAEEYGLTRSQFMRNLIVSGLEDVGLLRKLGIMKTVNIGKTIAKRTLALFKQDKIDVTEEGEIEIKE